VPPAVRVVGFDHVVFNVADLERSIAFYRDELGLVPARVEEWRRGEAPFPSVRVNASTIIDLVPVPRSGENVSHICLVVEPADFDALKASGRFEVVDGPATRWGARGNATSLYIRDPDGNTVELRHYGERSASTRGPASAELSWHTGQPVVDIPSNLRQ
jgi:catechol 2,3-dioxygenase-like lactoylglutathione lyase family enzyme